MVNLFKVLAFSGMCLNAAGTILLWRSSPGGYALTPYANLQAIKENNLNNMKMQSKQMIAIGLIVIGVALQVPLLLLG